MIVEFANHLQETGKDKLTAVIAAATRPPDSDDDGCNCGWPLSARARQGSGRGARNSIGIMLVTGMIVGTVFTLFVVPAIYTIVARRRGRAPARAGDTDADSPHFFEGPLYPARTQNGILAMTYKFLPSWHL